MSAFFFSELANRCANLACPNRPDEGRMVIAETPEPVVGGHRPLRFYLCYPCASALRDATTQKAVDQ